MQEHDTPVQLTLLAAPELPAQFRIDEATRRRGMRHIAAIRRQRAARHELRDGEATAA